MKITQVDISKIQPYENNPRKNTKAIKTVADSITQYGFQQPIVVDKDMVIIVGHTRYAAAKTLGLSQVPVSIADELTTEQAQSYRIMDNRSNENAQWDEELLFQELDQLIKDSNIQELSYETGFSESELNKLFKQDEDPVEIFLSSETYRSRPGDIWTLGEHRLANGDSTDAELFNELMLDQTIDMVWEDPPYGIAYATPNAVNKTEAEVAQWRAENSIENDDISPDALRDLLERHVSVISPKIRKGAAWYWCHDIDFNKMFQDILKENNIHVSDTLIWRKNNASNWLCDYARYYEPIIYGWKQGAEHIFNGVGMQPSAFTTEELEEMDKDQLIKILKSIPSNYQEFSKEPRNIASIHPTVKPTRLISYHIINSSNINNIVFDGFAGSGSTLIACEKTARKARCIEYEPKYCDAIIRRWQELTGNRAIRHDGVAWDEVEISSEETVYG